LYDIERLLKREIEVKIVAGFEVDSRIKAEPIENGRRAQTTCAKVNSAPFGKRKPQPQEAAPADNPSRKRKPGPHTTQRAKPATKSSGQHPGAEHGTGARRRFS
jgi:ATP-dependent RNA helicase RhlE